MSDSKAILSFIKDVRQKRLLLHAFYSISTSTLVILLMISLKSIMRKFLYFTIPYELQALLAVYFCSFFILFIIKYKNKASILKNSIYIDNRFSLKDRFSSYIDSRKKGIREDILGFQEKAITTRILHDVKTKKAIDFKSHFSFKYIVLLATVLFSLTYVKDKKRSAVLITPEEMKILKEQKENIEKFIAYLKNEDLENILSKDKVKEFSDELINTAEKIKKSDLERKDAIKMLSKLVDNTKKFMKEPKNRLDSAKLVSEFEADKLNKDNEFKDFVSNKQDELKEKMKSLSGGTKGSKEKEKDIKSAEEILDSIEKGLKEKIPEPEGEKKNVSDEELELTKEEMQRLRSEINKARKQLENERKKARLEDKLKGMKEDLEKSKQEILGTDPEGEEGDKDYEEKEIDIAVTFDSRIKNIQKGKSSTNKGPGTTNEDVGYSTFDTHAPQEGKVVHDLTKAEFEKIYAPSRTETETETMIIKGKISEGEAITISSSMTLPKKTAVNTPYTEIYKEYREVAQKAVDVQKVPRVYKDYVLDYFDSINPDLK